MSGNVRLANKQGWVGSRAGGFEAETKAVTVMEAETEAEASGFHFKI